jgi:hypothetical protein
MGIDSIRCMSRMTLISGEYLTIWGKFNKTIGGCENAKIKLVEYLFHNHLGYNLSVFCFTC